MTTAEALLELNKTLDNGMEGIAIAIFIGFMAHAIFNG